MNAGTEMEDIRAISSGLQLGVDGIWYSAGTQAISYPSDGNDACFAVEDRSFWFGHRNNCIIAAVGCYPPDDRGTIFDIGGGNGFVSAGLASAGFDIALLEPGQVGASNAKRRGLDTVICATTETADFNPNSLPAVGLFDVVEHIEDDLTFLKNIRTLMKKNGRLYVTVPAYSVLWSAEDVSSGHYRRYTLNQICSVIRGAGFEIEFSSYIFRFLPIPIAVFRALPYRLGLKRSKNKKEKKESDHVIDKGPVYAILDFLSSLETEKLKKRRPMGFGGSCLVVAKNS